MAEFINVSRFVKNNCKRQYHFEKLKKGKNHHNWKGGRYKDSNGYILIYQPDHPHANHSGCILEHRLVAEKALGRYLRPDEIVHHVDGIQNHNDYSNLLACPEEFHGRLHRPKSVLNWPTTDVKSSFLRRKECVHHQNGLQKN